MRRSKMIPFSAITDNSESALAVRNYSGPKDFFEAVEAQAGRYKFDLQKNQPDFLIEVFTEGKGKVQQIYELTHEYHIPVRSPGGYDSIAPKRELALRAAAEWKRTGRQTYVLHCGDFDPDGEELFRVFTEDAYAFLSAHLPPEEDVEDVLAFKRILTSYEQAMRLPALRRAAFDRYEVKEQNHRGQRWPHTFTAQLESVGLENILPVVKEEIEALLDLDQLEEDRKQSTAQRQDILRRVGALVEKAEYAEDAEDEPSEGEADVALRFVVEHLKKQTQKEIGTLLPKELSRRDRALHTKVISRRLARQLRQD
jgi:hypothetical protein